MLRGMDSVPSVIDLRLQNTLRGMVSMPGVTDLRLQDSLGDGLGAGRD